MNSLDYDSIEKDVFESYQNKGLPINIVDLAKTYKVRTLIVSDDGKFKFKSRLLIDVNNKFGDDVDYIICLNTKDALEQRLFIAYHLSTLILFYKKHIKAEDVVKKLTIEKSIPVNSAEYRLALSLLCPKQKVINLLTDKGFNKDNYRDINNYLYFTESFLVSTADFVNRLQFLFEGDLVNG